MDGSPGDSTCKKNDEHLGRETFLTPVVWKDGWPTIKGDRMEAIEKRGLYGIIRGGSRVGKQILIVVVGNLNGFFCGNERKPSLSGAKDIFD